VLVQAEELLRQLDQEKTDGSERCSTLNKQIRDLYDKTERLDSFDTVMEEKVSAARVPSSEVLSRRPVSQRALEEELTATRKRLVDTQEELDAWQRQTMVGLPLAPQAVR